MIIENTLMAIDELAWAPVFTVRRSVRAKRLSLRIIFGKLEVVVPTKVGLRVAHKFLADNRAWVDNNRSLLYDSAQVLPEFIDLKFFETRFQVSCMPSTGRLRLVESGNNLLLLGKDCDIKKAQSLLRLWLAGLAKNSLPDLVCEISKRYAIKYNNCNIRSQRTIWGSCSVNADISLNAKLLFCPPKLVEYVIVHELCHIWHHDHSKAFWSCVADCLPDYKLSISALRKIEKIMPCWIS